MTEVLASHPIRLEKLFFTRSVVIAVPEHAPVPGGITEGPVNSINATKIEDKPGHWNAVMHTVMNPRGDKTFPYVIDMQCMAELVADASLTEEEAARGIHITAHNVLYGAIREAVAWLTSRQPYGGLTLGLSVLKSTPQVEATKTP